jgi:hypothetical protein
VQTLFIEPGSPWENGYNESFNSKLRDELLRPYGASAPMNRPTKHMSASDKKAIVTFQAISDGRRLCG